MSASALLISGLREDPISRLVAGDQGRAIASHMSVTSPQLPSLIRARSIDLERRLEKDGKSFSQVLVLGIGFDPKPVRFSNGDQRWFGMDLGDTIRDRESRFTTAGAKAANFVPVIGDILSENWDAAIRHAGFRANVPTFIIAEGVSMYFKREVLATVFTKLRALTSCKDSRFWIDHASTSLFDLDMFEVKSFIATMAALGEPFITGFDDPTEITPQSWVLVEKTTAASAIGVSEPVHREYRFSVLRPA